MNGQVTQEGKRQGVMNNFGIYMIIRNAIIALLLTALLAYIFS